MKKKQKLEVPALRVNQGRDRALYAFAIDGKRVPSFATISRVHRSEGILGGYQRPEVLSHIAEIRRYLETDRPMIPNAVVIAFDSRVRFRPENPTADPGADASPGTLTIPIPADDAAEERPGFVVDGQQRLAAIRDARIETFPIFVTAFITNDVRIQTEQFILVNSTKPLPKGLIYELLPSTDVALPTHLDRRRFPAYLLERLNSDAGSPFSGAIQTPTNPGGIVKDNSILRMLENSLSDGVLYRYRDREDAGRNADAMLATLKSYWRAVSLVFRDAWRMPPRRSRLMHGAGIVSMGFVMDAIADRRRSSHELSSDDFAVELAAIKPACRWTDGYWDFGPGQQRKWNELQNTTRDIQLLSNYLMVQYKARVWDRSERVEAGSLCSERIISG